MMLLVSHEAALEHSLGSGHPEQPARWQAVMEALLPLADSRLEAPVITREALLTVHHPTYVDASLQALAGSQPFIFDEDAPAQHSQGATLRAAGGALAAVDAVLDGHAEIAFLCMRPPGHHAEPDRAMGFCRFSHAALAARHALLQHGLASVAVLDFDVHHGNGTQACLWEEPRVCLVSSHEMPLYPGSGHPQERGAHNQITNAPLPPSCDSQTFRRVWDRLWPLVESTQPELVIVSAGFDAHAADPLATCQLNESDYAWLGQEIRALAQQSAGGRLVSLLEGGYNIPALAASARAYVRATKA